VLLEKPLQLKRKMSSNISEGNTQLTRFSSNRASFAYNSSRLSDSSRASVGNFFQFMLFIIISERVVGEQQAFPKRVKIDSTALKIRANSRGELTPSRGIRKRFGKQSSTFFSINIRKYNPLNSSFESYNAELI
jgi:hypothetical protein